MNVMVPTTGTQQFPPGGDHGVRGSGDDTTTPREEARAFRASVNLKLEPLPTSTSVGNNAGTKLKPLPVLHTTNAASSHGFGAPSPLPPAGNGKLIPLPTRHGIKLPSIK